MNFKKFLIPGFETDSTSTGGLIMTSITIELKSIS